MREVMKYISPEYWDETDALIRELDLEFVGVTRIYNEDKSPKMSMMNERNRLYLPIESTVMENKEVNIVPAEELEIAKIESRIVSVRGIPIILDRDLALMYGVELAQMNRQVKRNIQRFPEDFMFQLTREEYNNLKCQNGILNVGEFAETGKESLRSQNGTIKNGRGQHSKYLPYVFTEQGVSMLSGLLRSESAIQANILIMRAFVAMRRFMVANADVFRRLDSLDRRQLETEHKLNIVLDKLEDGTLQNKCGIFFEGQTFDAYVLVSDLIRSAKKRVVMIDNYVDESVLTMLDKREKGVSAEIYTLQISKQLKLDITKHDSQYPPIAVNILKKSHDRFLIIDDDAYHVGASFKDLGKKWFAIMKMDTRSGQELINQL